MVKKIEFSEIYKIIHSMDKEFVSNDNLSGNEEDLNNELKKYIQMDSVENKAVLGIDIPKFNAYSLFEQSLITFILYTLLEHTISFCLAKNTQLFKGYRKEDFKKVFKCKSNGGIFILENPLQAMVFVIGLELNIKAYNGQKIYPKLRKIVGELYFRYAITYDKVYGFNNNYYGLAIVNNSKILSRENPNRCLTDRSAYEWLLVNMK